MNNIRVRPGVFPSTRDAAAAFGFWLLVSTALGGCLGLLLRALLKRVWT
jgi:hypothetical protein